ncbi:MAG: hypothetical protein K6A23_14700 [Butyrivibrio sp.]|nr:hypothetical protein [Butyrivibrio sp.]
MKKVIDKKTMTIYIVLEAVLFLAIKYREIISAYDFTMCVLKYLTVVIDFAVALKVWFKWRKGQTFCHDDLIFVGICFIFIADFLLTFLALVMPNEIPGFFTFCIVQAIFCKYLEPGKLNILIRIIFPIVVWIIVYKQNLFTITNAIGLLNITLIVVNFVCSWIKYFGEKSLKNQLFALGLTFFAICDVSLLFRRLTEGLVNEFVRYTVWTAYIPAIMLLTFSFAASVLENSKVNNIDKKTEELNEY